jgi:hypothetical protein
MVVFGLYLVHIQVHLHDSFACCFFFYLEPINQRYIRNPNQQEFNEGKMLMFKGTNDQYDDKDFIPVEIKAGKTCLG